MLQRDERPTTQDARPAPTAETSTTPPRRDALRGMSYAEGARALAPVQRQASPGSAALPGSAMILASSSERELTAGAGPTTELSKELNYRDTPIDDIFRKVGDSVRESREGMTEHPMLASVGTADGTFGKEGVRKGVFVDNDELTGDATGLERGFASRGFANERVAHVDGEGIGKAFGSVLGPAKAGDQIVAAFKGHGGDDKLFGYEREPGEEATYHRQSAFARMTHEAAARGAHVRGYVLACHAGGVVTSLIGKESGRLEDEDGANQEWNDLVGYVDRKRDALEQTESESIAAMTAVSEQMTALRQEHRQAQDDQQKARLQARVDALETEHQGYVEALKASLVALWKELRGALAKIAGAVSGADGRPPVAFPAELELERTRDGGGRYTFAAVFDAMANLQTRLLALAATPKRPEAG